MLFWAKACNGLCRPTAASMAIYTCQATRRVRGLIPGSDEADSEGDSRIGEVPIQGG
jgi:hypothetical protein